MGKKMSNAPVYFTVAQVQFNPILRLEDYLPTIQDRMRVTRFPDFKRQIIQQAIVPLNSGGGQQFIPSFQPQVRFIFGDIAGESMFVLESNALTLQTTTYDTFDTFSQSLLDGLTIIHEALQLSFIERVSLRYLDAVLPRNNESLADYLTPEVLGLWHKLTGRMSHSFSETLTVNVAGQLVSRVLIQDGQVGLPFEIAEIGPRVNPKFTQPAGRHAVIDTDAFYQQRETFDLNKIGAQLVALHDEISKSFEASVTPHALEIWA